MKIGIFLISCCVIFVLTEAQIVIKATEKKCFRKEDYVRNQVIKIVFFFLTYKKKLILVHI